MDECEGLLGSLEEEIGASEVKPERLASLIAKLPSSSVDAPRILPSILVQRLDQIAAGHSGTVPIHGRLFAQWMHHAFPRECSYPHATGSLTLHETREWMAEGRDPLATEDEMLKYTAPSVDVAFNATSDARDVEMPWSPEEELLIARSAPQETLSSRRMLVRNFILICALVCFLIALVRMLNFPTPVGGKQSLHTLQHEIVKSVSATFTESVLCRGLVLLVHGLLVTDVVGHRSELLQVQSQWSCCVWLLVVATIGLYLTASLSNPGWATQSPPCPGDVTLSAELASISDVDEAEPHGMQKRRCAANECEDSSSALNHGEELRWCTICSLHQPLRTKHCKDCGRCVRTHDHHCPWLGNCVGENNHVLFFWFLLLQVLELAVFFCEGLQGIDVFQPSIFLTLGLLAIAILFFMVVCLLGFHCFLMFADMTTWEYLSWTRITYLKDLQEDGGSPFTRSVPGRVAAYCFGPHWCPGPVRRLAKLRYDKDGGIVWEIGEQRLSCWLRIFVHWCRCRAGCARSSLA